MAKKYDKTNTWNLFKVDDENRKSDSYPNYSGWLNVDGTEYKITGWLREGRNSGKKFIGGNIEIKEDEAPKQSQVKDDTEIPF
tara:strand:+ start:322 stop:570 length:249 start_codon:yes stop_codon:yes gene_type:complete